MAPMVGLFTFLVALMSTNIVSGVPHEKRDTYIAYKGDGSMAAGWPVYERWLTFDNIFEINKPLMKQACTNIGSRAPDNEWSEIGQIHNAIIGVANKAQLDPRFILAVMLQESKGCVRVNATMGVWPNPGLLQSANGWASCNDNVRYRYPCPEDLIINMFIDGVMGTKTGAGLHDTTFNDNAGKEIAQMYYRSARKYNSGSVDSARLENGFSATPSYASDIANRLMGWTWAPSKFV